MIIKVILIIYVFLKKFFILETNRILIDIDRVKITAIENGNNEFDDIKHLDLALELCTAIRRKDYIRFFIIYRSLPRLASCLVNLFIDIYRKQILKPLIWGYVYKNESLIFC